jgi:hypothetical protein
MVPYTTCQRHIQNDAFWGSSDDDQEDDSLVLSEGDSSEDHEGDSSQEQEGDSSQEQEGDSSGEQEGDLSEESSSEGDEEAKLSVEEEDAGRRAELAAAQMEVMVCRETLSLVADNDLSQTGAVKLLGVLHHYYTPLLPPECEIPHTLHMLKKKAGMVGSSSLLLDVCHADHHVYDETDERTKCPRCWLPRKTKTPHQLLVPDVADRLRRMFAVPELAKAFRYPKTREKGDGDVWDGKDLKDTCVEVEGGVLACLALSSDG